MSKIEIREQGSIFDCGADAVVIPVNCVGVAGKGLALEARKRWPEWFRHYSETVCKTGFRAGDVDVWASHGHHARQPYPGVVLSAATKQHWRNPSTLLAVGQCLANLRAWAVRAQPDVLAIPALGCGLGGLDWSTVRPMIECLADTDYHGGIELRSRVIAFAPHE